MIRGFATSALLILSVALAGAPDPADGMQDSTAVYHAITEIHPARIASGDVVTIRGTGFPLAPWRTELEVDGAEVPLQHYEIVSPSEIRLTFRGDGTSGTAVAPGEREHTVAVRVDGKISNPGTFVEIRWGVVVQPRVFIPVAIYLVLVIGTLLLQGGGLFQSVSGNQSLSKMQLGIWILVFSFCYVLIASIWRDFIPLTPGMLWILGISSATAVGAKAIARKNDPTPPVRSRASRICSEVHPILGVYRCELHRCQVMLWTLILLVVWVVRLVSTLHLPDIPDALLILMGVGGGTYLGFKYPKTVARPPAEAQTGGGKPQTGGRPWRRRPRRKPGGSPGSAGGEQGDRR